MRFIITISCLFVSVLLGAQDALFNHFNSQDGLPSNTVYATVEDERGRIWFSTDKGLAALQGFEFVIYPQLGRGTHLTGFRKDHQNNIWAYNAEGELFQLKGNSFQEIALNEQVQKLVKTSLVNDLAFGESGDLWLSSIIGGGLFHVNPNSLNVEDRSSLVPESTYWVRKVGKQEFICGSKSDGNNGKAILYVETGANPVEIPLSGKGGFSKSKFGILQDGSYLFAAGSELIRFNDNQVTSRLFTENNVLSFCEDSEGKIWIGLMQGGLLCFPTGEVNSSNRMEYLGTSSVTDIYEDSQHNLWITTTGDGIYSYNVNPVLNYESPELFEGSDTTEVRQEEAVRLEQDPNLLVLERVLWDTVPPEIFISSIEINNKDTALLSSYELAADQNFLRIGFVGSLPGNPGLFQYRYKLSGVNSDWVYSSLNFASYPMLPPGNYSFEVSAMSKEGKWSRQPAAVHFVIKPFFYQTMLFRILVWSVILAMIIAGVFLYTRRMRIKEEQKAAVNKRIADLELMALRAQMNPHFMFNTLSSIQHFVSANNTEEALRYLSKFAKLMRVVLDNSKKKEITINDEIRAITLYLDLEKLRFKDKFDYSIEIDPDLDPSYDVIPSMLIQPYLENAILHGINNKRSPGFIKLKLSLEGENILCTIEDDGVGRTKAARMQENRSKEHKSQGMSITRDRLAIINRVNDSHLSVVIEDIDEGVEDTGTRVKIYVPFKNY